MPSSCFTRVSKHRATWSLSTGSFILGEGEAELVADAIESLHEGIMEGIFSATNNVMGADEASQGEETEGDAAQGIEGFPNG